MAQHGSPQNTKWGPTARIHHAEPTQLLSPDTNGFNLRRTAATIWIISKYFSSKKYGFETRSVAIARKWAAAGRQPIIIASDSNHLATFPRFRQAWLDEQSDGVRFRFIRTLRYSRSASLRRVASWLDFEWKLLRCDLSDLPRPDVIIVSSLSLLSVISGIVLARRYRVPWVFEVRDIWPLTLEEEGGYSRWHPLVILLAEVERRGYRSADMVVGTMPNLSPHVAQVARRPIAAHCIPFGFEPADAPALDALTPSSAGPASSRPLVVGYAGSMGIANALDTLIDCIVDLKHDPRFRFVMVGDGDLRAEYVRRTAGCENVEWVGRVPRPEVHAHLTRCDLLYFATHRSRVWSFGMSLNKLTDYLLAARPVLASYSGYPSVLNEADCGRFVPAADKPALREGLEAFFEMPPEERTAMGARGRAWLFEHRTWQRLADQYALLLDRLVDGGPHALSSAR